MILTFHQPDGTVVIAMDHEPTERTKRELDAKYGDKWRLKKSEPICSGLCPSCGYGEPLTRSTCGYCDGKCVRPTKEVIECSGPSCS